MRERFYYERDTEGLPLVTVCLIEDTIDGDTEVFARGVSICSPMEFPVKSRGRAIAKGMATKAMFYKETSEPINRPEAVFTIHALALEGRLEYRSEFMPKLTDFEKGLFE